MTLALPICKTISLATLPSLTRYLCITHSHHCILPASVVAFENKCGRLSDYALKYVKVLVNLCEEQHTADTIGAALLRVECN